MNVYKNIWSLGVTNALLFVGVILAYVSGQHEMAFVALLMLVISLVPFYMKGKYNIHIPMVFVYVSVAFIFASVGLGEFNKFYEKFHWYDAALHFSSAIVLGIVGFLFIYVFYATNRLRIPQILVILFAFSFALMMGVMWEIIEFGTDQALGTNLQVNSLEDTMIDLVLDAAGALLASLIGFLYLVQIRMPMIEGVVEQVVRETVVENSIVTKEVLNKDSNHAVGR